MTAKENRATFFARLRPFHAPSTLRDIELAYILAKGGHRSQVRKELDENGEPTRYFEHPRRVALIVIDELGITDPTMIIASLVHDGVEDTQDLTPEMLEHCFGIEVTEMVLTLSKAPKEGYLDRFWKCSDWRVYLIKGADRLDNLRSLGSGSREFQVKQVTETREKYFPLFDRMVSLTPAPYTLAAQKLRDELRAVTERASAMLDLRTEDLLDTLAQAYTQDPGLHPKRFPAPEFRVIKDPEKKAISIHLKGFGHVLILQRMPHHMVGGSDQYVAFYNGVEQLRLPGTDVVSGRFVAQLRELPLFLQGV